VRQKHCVLSQCHRHTNTPAFLGVLPVTTAVTSRDNDRSRCHGRRFDRHPMTAEGAFLPVCARPARGGAGPGRRRSRGVGVVHSPA
jgi:hypothetical protein